MLLVEQDGASSSPGHDLLLSEARGLAREFRDRGALVSIMRIVADEVVCVVADDEPLDTMLD